MNRKELLQRELFRQSGELPSISFQTEGEKLAYLAGIIDGEGCLGVYKRQDKKGRVMQWPIKLVIANNSERLMKWLVVNFGGRYYERKGERENNLKWKKGYLHVLGERKLTTLLPKVLPYLVIKQEEAQSVMEAMDIKLEDPFSLRLQELYVKMRKLKDAKGKGRPTKRQESFLR